MAYTTFEVADPARASAASAVPAQAPAQMIAQQAQPALASPSPVPLRHLLVALDGTAYAERALPYAAALARSAGLGLTVAHVRTPALAPFAGRLVDVLQHPLHARDHHAGESNAGVADVAVYLQWVQQALQRGADRVATDIELVDASSAASGLRELQERHEHSVTVIASRARQGAERLLLGSVADELVRHGTRLVLVIPPGVDAAHEGLHAELPSLARVLVPLDGSPLSERALAALVGWLSAVEPCERGRYEVTLLTVAESQASLGAAGDYVEAIGDALAAALSDVQVRAQAFVGSPSGMVVAAADQGFPRYAPDQRGADLVVMATHGRGRLGRWLYGSVASYVVPHLHIPVLLVTAPHEPDTM
jgi:nucleotide-binding universal stress UspA family protein